MDGPEPTNEEPAKREPADGEPTNGEPTNGNPGKGSHVGEGRVNEESTNERPASEVAANEKAANEEPVNEELAKELPTKEDPASGGPVNLEEKKKKKRKSKPKSTRGLDKPTGFEEYYVDPPVTPEEHKQEALLYDQTRPVEDRIVEAVNRFVSRRKFRSELMEVFDRYLVFGGISVGPSAFGGGLDVDAEDLNASEIASRKAGHHLSKAASDGQMVIDFNGVLKAFLSCNSPSFFSFFEEKELKLRINVIRNFLNYLLHHDACPEFSEQIHAAKKTCDVGQMELNAIRECSRLLPGAFNVACSTIFRGWYHRSYNENGNWGLDDTVNEQAMSQKQAIDIFLVGFASNSSNDMHRTYQEHTKNGLCQPLRHFTGSLEVTKITYASADANTVYALPMYRNYGVIGKFSARTWDNPAGYAEDLTEEEEDERKHTPQEAKLYEFWLEESILRTMFVGMKFEAEVYETTWGMYFLDTITHPSCSFFSYIPNDMMEDWREHVYLPPRPKEEPPTLQVHTVEATSAANGD